MHYCSDVCISISGSCQPCLREMSDGEDDTGVEKQYIDKKRIFKLKRFLAELDTFYQQKKLNLLQARSVSSFTVITWPFPLQFPDKCASASRGGKVFRLCESLPPTVFSAVHHGVSTCHRKAVRSCRWTELRAVELQTQARCLLHGQ